MGDTADEFNRPVQRLRNTYSFLELIIEKIKKSSQNDDKMIIYWYKTPSGMCERGYLPVVQWTQNNIGHPPERYKNLGGPGRSEGTAGGQRHLSFRRTLTGQWWWCGAGSEQTRSLRHRPAQCSSSTLWTGNLWDSKFPKKLLPQTLWPSLHDSWYCSPIVLFALYALYKLP